MDADNARPLVLRNVDARGVASGMVHMAATSGINENTNTLSAFNFPKITYGASASAPRAEQRADEATKRNIDINAKTWTAFNFPKITFV